MANSTLFPVNAYQWEAMTNVLERKGILTSKEVLDELEVIVATKGKTTKWQRIAIHCELTSLPRFVELGFF